jgi:hypothetical protein
MYPNEPEKLVVEPRGDQEVRYRLLLSPESVVEALVGHNRTLIDEGTTIGIIGTPLEQTVPMLKRISVLLTHDLERRKHLQLTLPRPSFRRSVYR